MSTPTSKCKCAVPKEVEFVCLDCGELYCEECSLLQLGSHKIVALKEEAMQFVRATLNKTFPVQDQEKRAKATLTRFHTLLQSQTNSVAKLRKAHQLLDKLNSLLENKIETTKRRAAVVSEDAATLERLKTQSSPQDLKSLLLQKRYLEVYKVKEALAKYMENGKANEDLVALEASSAKETTLIDEVMRTLDGKDMEAGQPKQRELAEAPRFVGTFTKGIVLYDLVLKQKRVVAMKGIVFHEYCEGTEAGGSIFITGGKDDNADTYELCLASGEGAANRRADMKLGRCNHAMCQLQNRFLFCGGGVHEQSVVAHCERFHIVENRWEVIAPLNETKQNGAMCGLADRYLYFAGGGKLGHKVLTSTIEVLDTQASETWQVVRLAKESAKWVPCECVNCVAISEREVLIFGGWTPEQTPRAKAYLLNRPTGLLSKLSAKLQDRTPFFYRVTPMVREGKVYGMTSDFDIHSYSIQDKKWSVISETDWKERLSLRVDRPLALTGRIHHCLLLYETLQHYTDSLKPKNHKFDDCNEAIVIGQLIYVVGGENYSKKTVAVNLRDYCGEVIFKADLNVGRHNHALEKAKDSWIYCVGGVCDKITLDHCEKYSLAKNHWDVLPRLTEAKQNIGLCMVNDSYLYCVGGGQIGNKSLSCHIERLDILDESAGWVRLELKSNPNWKPIECSGCIQVSPWQVFIFGGWKRKRSRSAKCFLFDTVGSLPISLKTKMPGKTGFYYAIRPIFLGQRIYAMTPDFDVFTCIWRKRSWKVIPKSETLAENPIQRETPAQNCQHV